MRQTINTNQSEPAFTCGNINHEIMLFRSGKKKSNFLESPILEPFSKDKAIKSES